MWGEGEGEGEGGARGDLVTVPVLVLDNVGNM